jgi:hypothetical protein
MQHALLEAGAEILGVAGGLERAGQRLVDAPDRQVQLGQPAPGLDRVLAGAQPHALGQRALVALAGRAEIAGAGVDLAAVGHDHRRHVRGAQLLGQLGGAIEGGARVGQHAEVAVQRAEVVERVQRLGAIALALALLAELQPQPAGACPVALVVAGRAEVVGRARALLEIAGGLGGGDRALERGDRARVVAGLDRRAAQLVGDAGGQPRLIGGHRRQRVEDRQRPARLAGRGGDRRRHPRQLERERRVAGLARQRQADRRVVGRQRVVGAVRVEPGDPQVAAGLEQRIAAAARDR